MSQEYETMRVEIQRLQAENADLRRELELSTITEDAYAGGAIGTIKRLKESLRLVMQERDEARQQRDTLSDLPNEVKQLAEGVKKERSNLVDSMDAEILQAITTADNPSSERLPIVLIDTLLKFQTEQDLTHSALLKYYDAKPDWKGYFRMTLTYARYNGSLEAVLYMLNHYEYLLKNPHAVCAEIMSELENFDKVRLSTVNRLPQEWIKRNITNPRGCKHETLCYGLNIGWQCDNSEETIRDFSIRVSLSEDTVGLYIKYLKKVDENKRQWMNSMIRQRTGEDKS